MGIIELHRLDLTAADLEKIGEKITPELFLELADGTKRIMTAEQITRRDALYNAFDIMYRYQKKEQIPAPSKDIKLTLQPRYGIPATEKEADNMHCTLSAYRYEKVHHNRRETQFVRVELDEMKEMIGNGMTVELIGKMKNIRNFPPVVVYGKKHQYEMLHKQMLMKTHCLVRVYKQGLKWKSKDYYVPGSWVRIRFKFCTDI